MYRTKLAPTCPIDRAAAVGRSADPHPNASRTNAYAGDPNARRTNSGRRQEHNSWSRGATFGNTDIVAVHYGVGHLRGRGQDHDRKKTK